MSKIIMPKTDLCTDSASAPVSPLEIRKYRNASNVPAGLYQNFDLTYGDKIFAHVNNNDLYLTNDFKKLQNKQLVEKVYFSFNSLPFVSGLDCQKEICFQNWLIPSASYRFSVTADYIDVGLIKKDLSLDEYTQRMYDRVIEDFKKIYDQHDRVYLHYSGGIDSLVCLSFILKLGLQKRTTLLYFRNLPEISHRWDPESSFINTEKKQAIENLFSDMADQVHGIIKDSVTIEDFLYLFNHGRYEDAQSYSTATMMHRYSDGVHIGGHLGNESLLHWHIYINDVLQAGHDIGQIKELCKGAVYSRNHVVEAMGAINEFGYKTSDDFEPVMELKHHSLKPRMALNHGAVKFYHPLMDESTSEDHRRLHWRDIDFSYLIDAKLARDIMKINVGNLLDQYVTFDGRETDSLAPFLVTTDKINPKILSIPDDLHHHEQGIQWHRYVLKHADTHGISTKTLMSFKAMNHLSMLCAGELDLYTPNPQYKF